MGIWGLILQLKWKDLGFELSLLGHVVNHYVACLSKYFSFL